jgi:hypothetical protein
MSVFEQRRWFVWACLDTGNSSQLLDSGCVRSMHSRFVRAETNRTFWSVHFELDVLCYMFEIAVARVTSHARIDGMGTTVATPHNEVPSGVMNAPSTWRDAPVRLSESLWGIDWAATFPCELAPGIWAEVASPETVSAFCAEHFGTIFGGVQDAGFWSEEGVAKERYLRNVCDAIIIRDGATDVGVVICNPVDWSTYYLRMAAFVPAYQGQNLVKFVVARLCRILADAGVARFECEAAPSNVRCIATALALGFVVTGTTLSERWGALSRLTRYLNASAEESYLDRFCAAGRSHRDGRQTVAASRGH